MKDEDRVMLSNKIQSTFEKTCEQVNSNASILSNWLYALNTSALGAIITLVADGRIKGFNVVPSAKPFLISLFFCILATGSEWLRFTIYASKLRSNFYALIKEEQSCDRCSQLKEHRAWLCFVTCFKIVSYVSLGFGIYSLIHNIGVALGS